MSFSFLIISSVISTTRWLSHRGGITSCARLCFGTGQSKQQGKSTGQTQQQTLANEHLYQASSCPCDRTRFIIPKREERTPFIAAGVHCRSVVRESCVRGKDFFLPVMRWRQRGGLFEWSLDNSKIGYECSIFQLEYFCDGHLNISGGHP
jgi:hypothetical protein